ncbi:hypothetical protein OIPHN260_05310 [Enterobacter roggenkampii]|uniref:Uncharacterized protein n=1 Tax=Enterobacter roggenkampii TaxID=1812935 RepID=A0AAU9BI51_9ENTR|nr:hypothetical protein OIPHN260_05310 [Enterobacter roggenkampii]
MGGIHPGMTAYLFEVHRMDVLGDRLEFPQPALEAQKPHATPLEALGSETRKPVCNVTFPGQQCPAGGGPEIKCQHHPPIQIPATTIGGNLPT